MNTSTSPLLDLSCEHKYFPFAWPIMWTQVLSLCLTYHVNTSTFPLLDLSCEHKYFPFAWPIMWTQVLSLCLTYHVNTSTFPLLDLSCEHKYFPFAWPIAFTLFSSCSLTRQDTNCVMEEKINNLVKLSNEQLDNFEQRLRERDLGARSRIPDQLGYWDIELSEETPPNAQSHVAAIPPPLRPDGQVTDLQDDFQLL